VTSPVPVKKYSWGIKKKKKKKIVEELRPPAQPLPNSSTVHSMKSITKHRNYIIFSMYYVRILKKKNSNITYIKTNKLQLE
jgi:hypothetical protein